jgi:hypothetical protein
MELIDENQKLSCRGRKPLFAKRLCWGEGEELKATKKKEKRLWGRRSSTDFGAKGKNKLLLIGFRCQSNTFLPFRNNYISTSKWDNLYDAEKYQQAGPW